MQLLTYFNINENNQAQKQSIDIVDLIQQLIDSEMSSIDYFKWEPIHGTDKLQVQFERNGVNPDHELVTLDAVKVGKLTINQHETVICVLFDGIIDEWRQCNY